MPDSDKEHGTAAERHRRQDAQIIAKLCPRQLLLFENPREWQEHWTGMPEFSIIDQEPWQTVRVHFASRKDREAFSKLVGQTITDITPSLWYPKPAVRHAADRRWRSTDPVNPRYPVYVISKGRWEDDLRLTSIALEKIGVPYSIVVEPQELKHYAKAVERKKILVLPFSNLGQGSIPARNWVWEHAKASGARRHWILDDNIHEFWRFHENLRTPVADGSVFRAAEDFVDRYENVAIAGFQYYMFCPNRSVVPPYVLNTRVYSCILIRCDLPQRWRGRYNEDTDLSLQVLKAGWATVLFNAFLARKMPTMTMRGGNTDELYKGSGRLEMARALQKLHPDVTTVVRKFGRWQHHVDYSMFRKTKLILRRDADTGDRPDNYGLEYVKLGSTA